MNNLNKEVYALERVEDRFTAMFLAGPTPRSTEVKSWRPEAVSILRAKGFDKEIVIPEDRNGKWTENYYDQINWEIECLNSVQNILFWIPRNMENMPGMTTNVEFGYIVGMMYVCDLIGLEQPNISFGFPPNTPHTRYLNGLTKFHDLPQSSNTLEETCNKMLEMI